MTNNFQEGEIVALWLSNHAVFAEYLAEVSHISPAMCKYDRALVAVPPGSENYKSVRLCALAPLSDMQKQEYVMQKLEGREKMKIQEK